METKKNVIDGKKKINYAMDGGFSGNQMCLNGDFMQIPFSVVDITQKDETLFSHNSCLVL